MKTVKSVKILNDGVEEHVAQSIWEKTEMNASYQFNRSHAVEYSVISYWCMWLKVHYPKEFFAAALSILGEDKNDGLVRDARGYGIEVLPPDINISTGHFEIRGDNIVAPFSACKGVSTTAVNAILEARKIGLFKSKADFLTRVNKTKCNKRVQEVLDKVGTFAPVEAAAPSAMHESRRKDQMSLMPGLIIDTIKTNRAIVVGEPITKMIVDDVVRPCRSCDKCSLSGGVHPTPWLGKKPKLMIVTDCPNYSEESAGKMLHGKASNYLKTALASAGLSTQDCYVTSLVKSPKSGQQLTNEQINGCKGYLEREIEILKPPVIVTLGSVSLGALLPGTKAAENQGKVIYNPTLDANVVVGFNPAQIAFHPGKVNELEEIFKTVVELIS